MKRKILAFLIALFSLSCCSANDDPGEIKNDDTITKLSFKSASSYDYLLSLNNTTVQINGYMATSSPVDGSFIFLMNLPYQSCPFCKPNTSQLSNTMEAYPKKNEKFSYTTSAIKVVGTLVVSTNPDEPFVDQYGYEFNFKLVDAEYYILKDSDLSAELALWQKVASSGLITDLYSMYDYVNFTCCWPEYFVNTYTNSKGETVTGYYLWAGDAINYIKTDGAQWNYGYKEGYFDDLISRLNKLSSTGFETLIANINKAKALAEYATNELFDGHYTYEEKYVEKFGTTDKIFTMNDTTLYAQWEIIYYEFTDWIGSFEM